MLFFFFCLMLTLPLDDYAACFEARTRASARRSRESGTRCYEMLRSMFTPPAIFFSVEMIF